MVSFFNIFFGLEKETITDFTVDQDKVEYDTPGTYPAVITVENGGTKELSTVKVTVEEKETNVVQILIIATVVIGAGFLIGVKRGKNNEL